MKKIRTVVWIGMFLVAFAVSTAQGAVISVGTWSPVVSGDVDNDGVPFWDGLSYDGEGCGVGHILATTNLCGSISGLGIADLEMLHDGMGGHIPFMFSGAVEATGFTVFTKNTAWTDSRAGISVGAGFKEELFDEATVRGDNAHSSNLDGKVWQPYLETRPGLYTSFGSPQQVALFRKDIGDFWRYWVAFEDIYLSTPPACQIPEDEMKPFCAAVSDRDYNDFGFWFDQAKPGEPVPEPTTLVLLGLGLLGAGIARRRAP